MTRPVGPDFVDQLAAAAREGREVLGEIRSELREVRHERKALAEERAAAEAMVRRAVHEEVVAAVAAELEDLAPKVRAHADDLYEKIGREAQRMTNVCLYGNDQGRGPMILDEIRAKLVEARRSL